LVKKIFSIRGDNALGSNKKLSDLIEAYIGRDFNIEKRELSRHKWDIIEEFYAAVKELDRPPYDPLEVSPLREYESPDGLGLHVA
jgi:hypothetical protein